MSNRLVDKIMMVIDADPDEVAANKAIALTECIARILVLHLDPVTAREIASCLMWRLRERISQNDVSNNSEFYS